MQYGNQEQAALSSIINEVHTASATRAFKIGGGSLFAEADRQPEEVERDLNDWYRQFNETIKRFESPLMMALAPQVGPLDTGPIHFDGGVPVRGFAQLTLYQSGHFNFTGHFHDSGAPSYNVAFAVAVRSQRGVLYTFARSGHMAGTFEPGSRDFDWNVQEHRPIIHEDWANIAVNSTWSWQAGVNWDIGSILGAVKTAAEAAGTIVSVIALL